VFKKLAAEPWFAEVDDVDFHSYCSCFDWEDPKTQPAWWAYRMGERQNQTLVKYRAETAFAGKGLFLTEAGTQTYGFKADNPAPGAFKASLKDTELLIRALNLGIDGFNHWSFVNRGDQDGQWQFVDTWDREWKLWLDEAVPHRDAYYVLGLATRHMPMRAKVLAIEVRGGEVSGVPRIWSSCVRSPKDDSLTLLIVNDAEQPWTARLVVEGLRGELSALRSKPKADPARVLAYEKIETHGNQAELKLEPFSLTILTDSPLPVDGPGRF
jgi:hypothetical protein